MSSQTATRTALSDDELAGIHAYWRAANYLSVGQIYLLDNPLLRRPLAPEHVKPRLLGHWGTTPGLNLVYAHLNRIIRNRDANVIFITGPGHGGPGLVANAYLEGTYSEVYTGIEEDAEGLRKLFRQSPATSPLRRRAPSTRVASWDTPWCTPTARRSTIPTW
jgi:xylulose-5-phosphate/fructose-6-phosphate phosphoketolase